MGAQGAQDALPDEVVHALREAFAAEVVKRLPQLRDSAARDRVRHEAHTLASSAWVIGEHGISELARSVERELEHSATAEHLTELVDALEGYAP